MCYPQPLFLRVNKLLFSFWDVYPQKAVNRKPRGHPKHQRLWWLSSRAMSCIICPNLLKNILRPHPFFLVGGSEADHEASDWISRTGGGQLIGQNPSQSVDSNYRSQEKTWLLSHNGAASNLPQQMFFSGSDATPSLDTRCPRYCPSCLKKWHLLNFAFSTFLCSRLRTAYHLCKCYSTDEEKTIRSSRYKRTDCKLW